MLRYVLIAAAMAIASLSSAPAAAAPASHPVAVTAAGTPLTQTVFRMGSRPDTRSPAGGFRGPESMQPVQPLPASGWLILLGLAAFAGFTQRRKFLIRR